MQSTFNSRGLGPALGLLLLAVTSPALGALSCQAPQQRPPCASTSAYGPDSEPGFDLTIGNPVSLSDGQKHMYAADIPVPLTQQLPSFRRFYHSNSKLTTSLGAGWQNEYDITLLPSGDGMRLSLPDQRSYYFDPNGQAAQINAGRVIKLASQQWQWSDNAGTSMRFDAHGRLLAINHGSGPNTIIEYYQSGPWQAQIKSIRRGSGLLQASYRIRSGRVLLDKIIAPLGAFKFGYIDNPVRLQWVRRPDGMQRIYHYEAARQGGNPHAITGVSIQAAKGDQNWRTRTWEYDRNGRVTLAQAGSQHRPIKLSYQHAGTTLQSGSAKVKLVHRQLNGQTVLSSWQAQACPGCPINAIKPGYDQHARLKQLDDLSISRYTNGGLRSLTKNGGGWPKLRLVYTSTGKLSQWHSQATGATNYRYHANGSLAQIQQANGRQTNIGYDQLGRPTAIDYQARHQPSVAVKLRWHGQWLKELQHPDETEFMAYDAYGLPSSHAIRRRMPNGQHLHLLERLRYDQNGRLLRHYLPEGGSLIYHWRDQRIVKLQWQDLQGRLHTVISSPANRPGYLYGNGLLLQTQANNVGQAQALTLAKGPSLIAGERRTYAANGLLTKQIQLLPAPDGPKLNNTWQERAFIYDKQHRMAAVITPTKQTWLAWAGDGSLINKSGSKQPLVQIKRDAAGLPYRLGDYRLSYNQQGLLQSVNSPNGPLVRYWHNARGQQIRQQHGEHLIEKFYLHNRLVATWEHPPAAARAGTDKIGLQVGQRYIYANNTPVGLIQTTADGSRELYYVHANLLGAPFLVTDQDARIRWRGSYDAFGYVQEEAGDIAMPLRLPGQDADPATGWHNNVFRTYLPQRGQYLEPDPLGPLPGQQSFGYAKQQMLTKTDSLGLILLAFDGTRYNQQNQSNVRKLAELYAAGPSFYHPGPGNPYYLEWDALTASSSQQILRNQWQSLLNTLESAQTTAQPLAIDILGYSRGAALARDFANRIASNTTAGWFSFDDPIRGNIGLCLDLRFLGLFETVAQFGLLGAANAGFDLSVAAAWQWVAHAVAGHEMRSLFPLVSASDSPNEHLIEQLFIGAHADIGGGMLLDDARQPVTGGDLSKVALDWMYGQARAALVPLQPLAQQDQQIQQPWLHDARSALTRTLPPGDRLIQDSQGKSLGLQGKDSKLGWQQREVLEQFIERSSAHSKLPDDVVGTVNMQAYNDWLQSQNTHQP